MAIISSIWTAVTRWSFWDIVTVVGGGGALVAAGTLVFSIVGDIKTSGAAKAQIACVQNINKSNDDAYRELADTNHRAAVAMQAERDKYKDDADAKAARIVVLQKLIESTPYPQECGYSDAITGALRK